MLRANSSTLLSGRVVVVSPHLDDGVLSLGATMAAASRGGTRVELLTIFACDPDSDTATGSWDRRAGHETEGESARARREEDRRACSIIGVTPVWLPFGSVDYDRHGDAADVLAAFESAVAGADAILLPGSPLSHPDHEWLVRAVAAHVVHPALGFYAEQPYTRRLAGEPEPSPCLESVLGTRLSFHRVPAGTRDRLEKWRAIREYRSQLPLLGMNRSLRRGPLAFALGGEAVAWVGRAGRARD